MTDQHKKYHQSFDTQNKDFLINIFTLSFSDKEKEKNFRKNYFEKSIYVFRISFVLVALLYAAFGIFDPITSPQNVKLFHFIRYAAVVPLLFLTFILSYSKIFEKIWQELIFAGLTIGGIGIVIMLLKDPGNLLYYGGLFLVFMAGFFFIKLRFFYAMIAGVLILLIYNIGSLLFPFFSLYDNYLLIANAFYVSAIIISLFALYHLEFLERKDFHQNLLLAKQKEEIEQYNKNLEDTVKERTQLLNERNIELTKEIETRKSVESELIKAKEKVEEISRLKSNFLANMSHEFRTPMNGILGMASILKERLDGNNNVSELIEGILKSGVRLMSTLDTILTLADLESYIKSEKKYFVEISSVVKEIFPMYKKNAEDKGLAVDLKVEDDSLAVYSLKKTLFHIIEHLLDNAIKFTDKGKVGLFIEPKIIDEKLFARISISDTGIGISREHFEIIFEDFRQASEGFSRQYEGSGLGLSIVKKSVDLLNGKITVESEKDKGSVFTILLPAEKVKKTVSTGEKPVQTEKKSGTKKTNLKGLLVEDNLINKLTIELYLKDTCTLDHARNGIDAINLASENKYDFILMDINLSAGINGVETTKEIRKISGYEETPVIAVTGYTLESDKEKLLSEGLTHFIPKPFFKNDVVELVNQIFSE